jgi:hypothetical protein
MSNPNPDARMDPSDSTVPNGKGPSSEMDFGNFDLTPLDRLPSDADNDDDGLVLPEGMSAAQREFHDTFSTSHSGGALLTGDVSPTVTVSPKSDRGFPLAASSPGAADAGVKRKWERGDRDEVAGMNHNATGANPNESSNKNQSDETYRGSGHGGKLKLLTEGLHEKQKKKLRKLAQTEENSTNSNTTNKFNTPTYSDNVNNADETKDERNRKGKQSQSKNPFFSNVDADPELHGLVPMEIAKEMASDMAYGGGIKSPSSYIQRQESYARAKLDVGLGESDAPDLKTAIVLDVSGKRIGDAIRCFSPEEEVDAKKEQNKETAQVTCQVGKGGASANSSNSNGCAATETIAPSASNTTADPVTVSAPSMKQQPSSTVGGISAPIQNRNDYPPNTHFSKVTRKEWIDSYLRSLWLSRFGSSGSDKVINELRHMPHSFISFIPTNTDDANGAATEVLMHDDDVFVGGTS